MNWFFCLLFKNGWNLKKMPGCVYNSTRNWWKYKREHNMWLYAFYSYRIKKNSNFKTFWSYNAKKSGWTKKNSWSISSNRDQIYNGTIENYYCAKKKLLNFQKKLPGIRSYAIIFLVTIDRWSVWRVKVSGNSLFII